jgi:hypothetical protein
MPHPWRFHGWAAAKPSVTVGGWPAYRVLCEGGLLADGLALLRPLRSKGCPVQARLGGALCRFDVASADSQFGTGSAAHFLLDLSPLLQIILDELDYLEDNRKSLTS